MKIHACVNILSGVEMAPKNNKFSGLYFYALVIFLTGIINNDIDAVAKDFGVQGPVYPIKENNLLHLIEKMLQKMKDSGKLEASQQEVATRVKESIMRPASVAGLNRTQEERVYMHDPTLVVEEDIKDHKGNIIAKKGYRLNPLDHLNWGSPILLIDGDDEEQVSWASQNEDTLILVKGSPIELEKKLQRAIYFDQGGRIVKKFGILQVPCRISQLGKTLLVEELKPKIEGAKNP